MKRNFVNRTTVRYVELDLVNRLQFIFRILINILVPELFF